MYHEERHTVAGALLTEIILEVFRLHGSLLAAGDAMTADLELTSARWQVLGALSMTDRSLTLAGIARSMGLSRQAVRRTASELQAKGFVAFRPNPEHRRAHLVVLTERGRSAYAEASKRQVRWVNQLAGTADSAALASTNQMLRNVRERLDQQASEQGDGDE